jgi:hypothetical protein
MTAPLDSRAATAQMGADRRPTKALFVKEREVRLLHVVMQTVR